MQLNLLSSPSTVPCPHCGQEVVHAWKPNSEYTLRCPLPCGHLFAVRTHGFSIQTAPIQWDKGYLYWQPASNLASVIESIAKLCAMGAMKSAGKLFIKAGFSVNPPSAADPKSL